MELYFSAIFAREAVVLAADTGRRGLELRKGGDILGGGTIMFARRDGLFWLIGILDVYSRLPGDFMRMGV